MEIIETDRGLACDLTLLLPHGLHARPSARLAQTARQFHADILLTGEQGEADAKSMLELLSLALQANAHIRRLASGDDAKEALKTLYSLLTQSLD